MVALILGSYKPRRQKRPTVSGIVFGISLLVSMFSCALHSSAQGSWRRIGLTSPDYNYGVMLVLTDGTIMVKAASGGVGSAFYGNQWDLLTPDAHGSYVNGTWRALSAMDDTRLYFSSQVLKDGRVYVAGGEYGTGANTAEIYDPLLDVWTYAAPLPAGDTLWDANSEILPDGRILQSVVKSTTGFGVSTLIYDPVANTFTAAATGNGSHDESTWLKLKDNSILVVDDYSRHSERYIPSLGRWVVDADVPVAIYDTVIGETGPAALLPDGRAMFFGGNGNTAFYTPSGTSSPGSWAAGPKVPQHYASPDASAAMMSNGKILLAVSDTPTTADNFPSPTYFFEFNYLNDSFTQVKGPLGTDSLHGPCFDTHMTNMPDGTILFSYGTDAYYEYVPDSTPLAAGQPTVDSIIKLSCDTFMVTGTMFNGLTEGSTYGDDWQMSTNYPLVRLISGDLVYYARTSNWNRVGAVMTGSLPDTAMFTLPSGLPLGTYSLQVVANGIPSSSVTFQTCPGEGVAPVAKTDQRVYVYPNPAAGQATLVFGVSAPGAYTVRLVNIMGQVVSERSGQSAVGKNSHLVDLKGIAKGVYTVVLQTASGVYNTRLVVE